MGVCTMLRRGEGPEVLCQTGQMARRRDGQKVSDKRQGVHGKDAVQTDSFECLLWSLYRCEISLQKKFTRKKLRQKGKTVGTLSSQERDTRNKEQIQNSQKDLIRGAT